MRIRLLFMNAADLLADGIAISEEGLAPHRAYIGRLEHCESGATVEPLAAILAPMSVSIAAYFSPFSRSCG